MLRKQFIFNLKNKKEDILFSYCDLFLLRLVVNNLQARKK